MKSVFKRRGVRIGLGVAGAVGVVLCGALAWVASTATLPMPAPSGPHPVGFRSTTLVDARRANRVITLDMWYPAANIDGRTRAPRTEPQLAALLQRYMGVPDLGGDGPSFAYQDAPQRAGALPVMVFNHGYGSFTKQNSVDFEHLASAGWLVVSIGHPGSSLLARDASGAPVEFDGDSPDYQRLVALQRNDGPAFAKRVADAIDAQRAARDATSHRAASIALRRTDPYPLYENILRDWVDDTRVVLAALPTVQGADASRVFLMGHSLGGNTVLELARTPIPGVRGVISLDAAWLADAEPDRSLRIPMLTLLSTENKIAGMDLSLAGSFDGLLAHSSPGAHVIEISGSAHFNFTDMSYVPIVRYFSPVLGPVDGAQMMQWQRAAIAEFVRRVEADDSSPTSLLTPDARLTQRYFAPR